VTTEVDSRAENAWIGPFRRFVFWTGVVLWLIFLVPPISTWSLRYEYVQAIQFTIFAYVAPVLLISGAQWRVFGLSIGEDVRLGPDGGVAASSARLIDRMSLSRLSRSFQRRSVLIAGLFIALTIFWRTAPAVNALVRTPWLVVLESLSLVALGSLMFTHLVESPPLQPGATRPYRICMATAIMWAAWVVAYLDGMSNTSWYNAFHHVAGRGVSLAADQQLSAGAVWFITAGVFIPIIFWNLIHWLQSEEDPNAELVKLIREERSRGFFGTN
jgi:cytochrome c oxidase assembly factor CtaG